MSEAMSPGRRRALELGRQHGTIREGRTQFTAPDGKPGGQGASEHAKPEPQPLAGANVPSATEKPLPFKRS